MNAEPYLQSAATWQWYDIAAALLVVVGFLALVVVSVWPRIRALRGL